MDTTVELRTLDGMICASFWGYGKEPEQAAWAKLRAWAEPRGVYGDFEKHPVYGFDNPRPSQFSFDTDNKSGSYGYEFLLRLDERCEAGDGTRIVEFRGGLYATAFMPDFSQHGKVWTHLMGWPENNGYEMDLLRPWIEEHVSGTEDREPISLRLHLPVIPAKG